ncbi:MAG: hypothetical protein FJY11_08065, partial [Bacteroidetes bacterium]|nr:hypothetical protein [Bacteroidota bacterium]
MKKVNLPLVASALTLLFVTITFLHAGEPGYRETRIKWKRERISRGLLWIHAHTVEGDTLKQNINILIVDTRKKVIDIVYEPGQGRRKADIQAAEAGGTAAVNGGFFNAAGGSVTYLRNDGIIHDTDTATAWPRNANLNGAVMVEGTGRVHLIPRATNEWFDKNSQFIDILVSGPV